MFRVAILIHPCSSPRLRGYWIGPIANSWRERGATVSVISDPHDRTEADVAILHVDLTRIPDDYLAWAKRFKTTVNGGVADISKRAISTNLVRRGDSFDGPVIVKTDRNCAGDPERYIAWVGRVSGRKDLRRDSANERRREARRVLRYGPGQAFPNYSIYDSVDKVPEIVWRDRYLVVERFLPEREGDRYCVRTWLFFGDRERHAIFYSRDPIVKSRSIIGHDQLGDVPEELRERRRELRFDFGKFDYTMVNGKPVLLDANRTPTFGNAPPERYRPIAASLSLGLEVAGRSARGSRAVAGGPVKAAKQGHRRKGAAHVGQTGA
jgi:hypothetical protein